MPPVRNVRRSVAGGTPRARWKWRRGVAAVPIPARAVKRRVARIRNGTCHVGMGLTLLQFFHSTHGRAPPFLGPVA